MFNTIKMVIKGIGYLPGYGHHPGIPMVIAFSMIGFFVDWRFGFINLIVCLMVALC